jgi:methylmalonyl-CoA/ethylmalonyl-CoA epimerase
MSGSDGAVTILRFHHIGYAVQNIRSYLDEFFIPLFAPLDVTEPVTDPIQRVRVCFARVGEGPTIEFVEPLDAESALSSVIGSIRGGVYHLCYEVDDLDEAMKVFRRKRCMPVGKPVPALAFNNRRIVFFLTPQHDLIELLEARISSKS